MRKEEIQKRKKRQKEGERKEERYAGEDEEPRD